MYTHASCKIPLAARRRGDSPTLEMILAVGLELLIANALPMILRVQKMKTKSHPSKPWRPCLMMRYIVGKARAM
jgi:hypothetical protein